MPARRLRLSARTSNTRRKAPSPRCNSDATGAPRGPGDRGDRAGTGTAWTDTSVPEDETPVRCANGTSFCGEESNQLVFTGYQFAYYAENRPTKSTLNTTTSRRLSRPYTFLYMFHPFPEIVLRDVLDNLFQSLTRRPRKLTLVYYNPACHDALIRAGFSKTGEFNHGRLQFCTYTIGG